MASHFSDIGFVVQDQEDYQQLLDTALESGQPTEVPEGYYILFNDVFGVQLYIQADPERNIVGVNPHFKGKSSFRVGIRNLIDDPEYPLDGRIRGWANPPEDDYEAGHFPFVFDTPNYRIVKDKLKEGMIRSFQITAFAHDITLFADEDAYEQSQGSQPGMAAESFIPGEVVGDESRISEAFFTGTILMSQIITNSLSGKDFVFMQVRTLGGVLDVVADLELLEEEAAAGGIIQGAFWLSGVLIE
ncbi:hypothetical protein B9G55_05330 [Saccharibacillus sp. O16]|nr:hypothetical protein B9G55_05330 [Saccharibacillus sp. O16]